MMLKNYLKIAYRNILKSKVYSFINIAGLAFGITSCILIMLFVQDELSYDNYHEKSDRIYRVVDEVMIDGVGERAASMAFPVGTTMPEEFPNDIETSVRFFNMQVPTVHIRNSEDHSKSFNESRFFYVDSNVFQVFSYEMIQGNPNTALVGPNLAVLTESTAKRYFGNENPLGKTLSIAGRINIMVNGIVKDVPINSHLKFDILVSMSTYRSLTNGRADNNWYWNPVWTYILLKDGVNPKMLEDKFPDFIQKYFPESIRDYDTIFLQKLTDIHLTSHLEFEIGPNSDESYVYIFSAIAIFVLIVACINFMNLATARSGRRGKEVGMRKTLGAARFQVISQFFSESILLTIIASLLAVVMTNMVLPSFNEFSGKELVFDIWGNSAIIFGIISIVIVVGIFSGSYPALFLSSFQPVKVLKGTYKASSKNAGIRKVLVVGQFSISIFLIIGTWVCYNQLNFLQNEKLGFEKDHIVVIPTSRTNLATWYETYKTRISGNPLIKNVSATGSILGANYQTGTFESEGNSEDRVKQIPQLTVHYDFIEMFDLEMVAGRSFSLDFPSDTTAAILNETAARQYGWTSEEAIGKRLTQSQMRVEYTVVGVARDFNFASLHQPIEPLIIEMSRNRGYLNGMIRYMVVKVEGKNYADAISLLQSTWDEVVGRREFEYFFLDDNLNRLYSSEATMGKLLTVFSILAIIIACLGLFALAAFASEQRTKEIGVRKVMGSSIPGIVVLLSKEFTKWIVIANIIAWPVAYLIMDKWLEGFAYKTNLDVWMFFGAGLFTLFIAIITVSYQAIKAAVANPVQSLRSE